MSRRTSATPALVSIRGFIRRDLDAVMSIEAASHEHPWSTDELLDILRNRYSIGMVAEHGDAIVGVMVYGLHPGKIQLLDLAVRPDCRRRGVGRQMVEKLVGKLSGHRNKIVVRARETNLPCLQFLKAQGFRAVGLEQGHFEDSGEDAVWMVRKLAPPPCPKEGHDFNEEATKWT